MGVVRKFALALGSMLALILFVSAIGFIALDVLERKAADIVADSMRMQRLALEVDSRLELARHAEKDFILRVNDLGVDSSRDIYASEFKSRLEDASRNVAWLQDMERFRLDKRSGVQPANRLAELHQSVNGYYKQFGELVKLAETSVVPGQVFTPDTMALDIAYHLLKTQVHELGLAATDGARSAHAGIEWYSRLVKHALIGSVIVALLLAVSIVWVLNRTVARSVVRLRDAATELSLGNLEARAVIPREDEFGQVADSINTLAVRMTALINDLESQANVASDRLLDAIDAVSEGFLLFDSDERLVMANRQMLKIARGATHIFKLGVSLDEMALRSAKSGLFLNAIGREAAWAADRVGHMRSGQPHEEQPLSNGLWVQTRSYLTAGGERVVVISDVTERRQAVVDLASMNSDLENLVRERTQVLVEKASELKAANKRLRELDELKSSFLSSVSHELRTPLTSLLGFSKLIRRDFNKVFMPLAEGDKAVRLGTRIQSNLDIIGSEGERLTRLINDVLDLSRIESGMEEWLSVEVDMPSAVNRAISSASGLYAAKPHVQLALRRFDMVPPVHGDPDRFQQVLINLLSNAAKFTDVGEVAVDLYLDELGKVHLRVEDSGVGIEPEYLESVFDKFHLANVGDTVLDKPHGTGLGLTISRQIVEQYGGRIWAESAKGQGTTFHVTLPPVELPDIPLVLVVDDDAAARDYLGTVLRQAGYNVCMAADGEEALAMARGQKPSLITMDLSMPGMDGRTAIELLRKDSRLAGIPVLVVSVAEDCLAAGGDAALLKPVNGDTFILAVKGLLGSEVTRPLLALNRLSDGDACVLSCQCGDNVVYCSEEEMWQRLMAGYEGTVVVPESLAADLDLARLCATPQVHVLLLPESARSA